MALSEPDAPNTVSDIPGIAQHYLVCGTEDCENNCKFYCNDCHRSMCEQCRDEHQKSPDTKNHEMVPYRQRKIQLPVKKCKDHPTKDIDMFCQDCQVPGCSKCVTQDHKRHTLMYLETIYSEKCMLCHDNINKIHQYFIPSTQDMQRDIKEDTREIKEIVDKIRTSMKIEAESFKSLVDTVTSDNIEQVTKMEESLMKELQNQDKTYQDYISYLEGLVKEFGGYLSSTELHNNPLIISLSSKLTIKPISETTKPVPPVFTAGQYSKEDVTKLLGRVTVPDTKPEVRKIKPTKTASTQSKIKISIGLFGALILFSLLISLNIDNRIGKEIKQEREEYAVKQTPCLPISVTKVREYTIPGIGGIRHMSLGEPGRLWVSDSRGNIVQTDLHGNQLQKIQNFGESVYYTVTQDGDLIFIGIENKVFKRFKLENTITEFIKTGDWKPISIHSSRINGDILVGMVKDEESDDREAKVTRYNKEGKEIQNIQWSNNGHQLYFHPHYITENINGDICTSDIYKETVDVVNKSGQYRFSYTDYSWFLPMNICTDRLGHILVRDDFSNTIHLVDQDGMRLSLNLLYTEDHGQEAVAQNSICVDDENNLHVQQDHTNTVTVFKYLQ